MLMHMAANLFATLETVVWVEWLADQGAAALKVVYEIELKY